ncbi:MAG: hypothetical protein ACOH2O_13440 [Pseudomonas sp.]
MSALSLLQNLTLSRVNFGGINNDLLQVVEGGSVFVALDLATNLSLAVEGLCSRLDFSTNNNCDPVTCAELRALELISGTAAALLQSIRYSLKDQVGVQ